MATEAGVGFRVKSGWAVAVLVSGTPASSTLLDLRRVELADPACPESVQPFHAGLEHAKEAGAAEVARLVAIVERFAKQAVHDLLRTYADRVGRLEGAGVVVGSQVDPSTIRNDHIRAHAQEGRLFGSVVVDAAAAFGLKTAVVAEKRLYAEASAALRRSTAQLQQDLAVLGRAAKGRPWRSEEKGAALAAWMSV